MPESLPTLLARLDSLPSDSPLIRSGEIDISTKHLARRARELRAKYPSVSKARVAVRTENPLDTLFTLIALDGYCSGMLLLPSCTNWAFCQEIANRGRCSHLLFNGQVQPLRDAEAIDHIPDEESYVGNRGIPTAEPVKTEWLLTTSGTTGLPKLISHTLETLARSVKANVSRGRDYRWGLLYDPCRFAGLQVVLQSLLSGSCLVMSDHGSLNGQLVAFVEGEVNAVSGTPSNWRKLLMDRRIDSLPLKQITLGGEIADQSLLNVLKHKFPNSRIVHIYASTEAGVGFAVTDGCAGFPAAWIDTDASGVDLRIRSDGHLLLRSPGMASGEDIRAYLDEDNYLDTGDLVRIEEDRVHFLGRASGAINVGGNKVSPEEVEGIIRQVEGVLEVRVRGMKNPIMGELVVAEIVADPSVEEGKLRVKIQSHCRERLDRYKVPAFIKLVDNLSESAAGKIERRVNTP